MAQVMRQEAPAITFNGSQRQGVNQNAPGAVSPDFAKHRDANNGVTGSNVETNNTSVLDGLVSSLAGTANRYLQDKLNTEKEEAYLAGQTAAQTGAAKETVESNILTRDWATAGYSDTRARLAIADADTQMAVDMKKLREQPPEAMKEYLAERRKKLMPLNEGMSLDARKSMMAQMALGDQHAVAKHLSEHQKHIIDTQIKGVQVSTSTAFAGMDAAKDNEETYKTATDAALGTMLNGIIMNPNLPPEAKAKLLEDAAVWALEGNHQQLFEKMQTTKDPNGHTMLDNLDFGARAKLVKAYQSSRKETSAMRNGQLLAQLGQYKAQLDDEYAPPVPYEDHQAHMARGVAAGVISADGLISYEKEWKESQSRKSQANRAGLAWASANIQEMAVHGISQEQGVNAYVGMRAKAGVPVPEIAAELTKMAVSTGQLIGFTKSAELLKTSITAALTNEEVDPTQLAGVDAAFSVVEAYDAKGDRGGKASFLKEFDDETRTRILAYRDARARGQEHGPAAATASEAIAQHNLLTPQQRAARGAHQDKENVAIVEKLEPKGLFAQLWEKNPFRFGDNAARDKISPARKGVIGWRDDAGLMAELVSTGKLELTYELNEVSRKSPFLSAADRETKALTALSERTVLTDGGPLILPRGQSVQSFFGVPRSVSADVVGGALSSMRKPADNGRIAFKALSDGRMQWKEYNRDTGVEMGGDVFDPKSVTAVIQAEQDKRSDAFARTDGAGITTKGKDGSEVRYNGDNTIGIGTGVMLQFRQDLVKHEGVTNKPYPDGSGGRTSVGVGVNSGNPRFYPKVGPDGTVSKEDITRSFMGASNAAMQKAHEYFQDLPKERQNTFATRMLGNLSYQGGSVGGEKDPNGTAFLKTLNDPKATQDTALTQLKTLRQYKMSPDSRKRYYEDMLTRMIPRNNF